MQPSEPLYNIHELHEKDTKNTNNTDDTLLLVVKVSAAAHNYSIRTMRRFLHWLIDSDCGVHMTSDRSLFATYDEWSGGAAQVGDGDKLRAVGRGRLKPIIVRNHSTGTPVTLRVQQYAWHVPTLVFDILSIPMLQKDRIQVNLGAFNERTAPMNYLRDYTTGAVVKLSLMNGIFVMKPVNAAQVPASLRGEIEATSAPAQTKGVAEGIMPRRHHNIPLWFVFGHEQAPVACTIAVSSGKRTGRASW